MNNEEYREKIIEMIKKIDNVEYLHFIHRLMEGLTKSK